VTFEFVVILGAILLITAVIFLDFHKESSDTFVLNLVKSTTLQKLADKVNVDPTCANGYLKQLKISGNQVLLTIVGCDSLDLRDVASTVAAGLCSTTTADLTINCGGNIYTLVKQ